MTASYRKVDYSLRPAKFSERKMLCEVFSRLRPFSPLQRYLYVGFGSIWFADYTLFHRSLGIREMISMERVSAHKTRFIFNRPFGNVDIRVGAASQHLPTLDWGRRIILWLDYDDPLSPSILDDLHTVATRAESGMALAISVQAEQMHSGLSDDDETSLPIRTVGEFSKEFGNRRTPQSISPTDLMGWGIAATTRKLLCEELHEALVTRNLPLPDEGKLAFRQVAAFEYADDAKMTTIVGIFVNPTEHETFLACGFRELHYFTDGPEALRIKVPKLTPREMRHLDSLLPTLPTRRQLDPIPPSEAENYARLYRYLPNFAAFEP